MVLVYFLIILLYIWFKIIILHVRVNFRMGLIMEKLKNTLQVRRKW